MSVSHTMPNPEVIAIELDRLALDQTGPERGELVKLAADIQAAERYLTVLVRIGMARMAEIREAAVTEVHR